MKGGEQWRTLLDEHEIERLAHKTGEEQSPLQMCCSKDSQKRNGNMK